MSPFPSIARSTFVLRAIACARPLERIEDGWCLRQAGQQRHSVRVSLLAGLEK